MSPARHVELDPRLDISPYTVYRRLAEGEELLLVDLRRTPATRPPALRRALDRPPAAWTPPADRDVVVFDQDGCAARETARSFQAAGLPRVRSLFGGLDLWDLALGGIEEASGSPR